MSDWLVKLYDLPLPSGGPVLPGGATVRKPIGPEHQLVVDWAADAFGPGWASEAGVALCNRPVSLFVLQQGIALRGFACYDATARGMFGPIGVAPEARGQGLGAALLLACLHDMRSLGYAYAVVGSAGPGRFFERTAGAVEIPGSSPGPYRGMLRTGPSPKVAPVPDPEPGPAWEAPRPR